MGSLRSLWVLMVTAFVDTLGSFLVSALLPFYASHLGASPFEVGALMAAFFVAQTLSAPLWGQLSDSWGRRPVILLGLGVSAVAYVGFAFADSLGLLMVARLAQGLGGGTVSVVFAFISDAMEPERRASGIGWVTAATSLAAMVGPAIGSLTHRIDPAAPGLVTAALCLVTLLFATWRLAEPVRPHTGTLDGAGPEGEEPDQRRMGEAILDVIVHPRRPLSALIWTYTIGMLAVSAVMTVGVLFLQARFAVTEDRVWIFFAYVAGLSMLIRAFVLTPVVERFGEVRVLRAGCLCLGLGVALMPLPSGVVGFALAVALIPLGTSLLFPCNTSLVSQQAPRAQSVGLELGVQQGFGGMARILGPLWAGSVFQHLGPGTPFFLAGGYLLIFWVGILGLPLTRSPGDVATDDAEADTA